MLFFPVQLWRSSGFPLFHIDGHVDAIPKAKGDPFRKKLLYFCIPAIVFTKSIALFENEATHFVFLKSSILMKMDSLWGLRLLNLEADEGAGSKTMRGIPMGKLWGCSSGEEGLTSEKGLLPTWAWACVGHTTYHCGWTDVLSNQNLHQNNCRMEQVISFLLVYI